MPAVPVLFSALPGRYSKSYLGTVRPSRTVLSSPLRWCSSANYAMALQFVTAALYCGFRRCSPLRCACAFYPLPALSCALPVNLSFAALALAPHYPGAHLRTLPTITSALHRYSPPCYAVAPFPIPSALPSSLRRQSSSPFSRDLLQAAPALWFAHRWRFPPCARAPLRFTGTILHPTLAVSSALSQCSSLCWAGALLGSSRALPTLQPG